jgi:serine protease Do
MRLLVLLLTCFAAQAQTLSLPQIISQAKPSVVAVGTYQSSRNPSFRFLASGFAVGDGLSIVTNAHVVTGTRLDGGSGERFAVVTPKTPNTPQELHLRLLSLQSHSPSQDLAHLRIVEGLPLPALSLATTDTVQEGQSVLAIGYPIGSVLGLTAVSHRGMVSAITPISIPQAQSGQLDERSIRQLRGKPLMLYQLDLTAYPGSSGSPVLDAATGQVIAIISGGASKGTKEMALSAPTGITYAIPVQYLEPLLVK